MSFLVRECISGLAIGGSLIANILPSQRDTAQWHVQDRAIMAEGKMIPLSYAAKGMSALSHT